MPPNNRKQIRVNADLIPLVQNLANAKGVNFNAMANELIEGAIYQTPVDLTASAVERVLPAFTSPDLLRLAIASLAIMNARGIDQNGTQGQQAITAWTKFVNGEKLSILDLNQLAQMTGTSLIAVQEAIEQVNQEEGADPNR